MNMQDLVGMRIIVSLGLNGQFCLGLSPTEYRVVEVSPNNDWVKLADAKGADWYQTKDVLVRDVLRDNRMVSGGVK